MIPQDLVKARKEIERNPQLANKMETLYIF